MMKNFCFPVTVVLALFVVVATAQAVRPTKDHSSHKSKQKQKGKSPSFSLPPLVNLEPGKKFFEPSIRLSGIGLDREGMSQLVLEARTKKLIDAHTFTIMSHPRALSWAQNCTSPKVQKLIEDAARDNDFPQATLEGLAFVESGCDPTAVSWNGCCSGIMQFSKPTGRSAGLRIEMVTRERLVPAHRELLKKAKKGRAAVFKDVPAKRQKYQVLLDERMDPEKAIPAAAKYLSYLSRRFGGVDFAVWAYHSGEGRMKEIRELVKEYDIQDATAPLVFFGNHPRWREDLYQLIQKDMAADSGPTYYFCIKKAEQLMALYRQSPKAYKELAKKYANPIKPEERTPNRLWVWYSPDNMYKNNADLEKASGKEIVPVPHWPQFFSYTLRTTGPESIGEKDPAHRELFLQDPPEVIGGLQYLLFETRRLWEQTRPKSEKFFVAMEATAFIRNEFYQGLLAKNPNSHTAFPTHCVGAVDISYLRLPKWETECLRFVVQDMAWDEYIAYFWESKERSTMHMGVAPTHKEFFTRVYQESLISYNQKK